MKKILVVLINLTFSGSIIIAQDTNLESTSKFSLRKNSIYLEILGNAAVWSINYDRLVPINNELALFFRIGGNEYHGKDTTKLSFNILEAAGILYGGPNHFFEASLGSTQFQHYPDFLIVLTAGYRFQRERGFLIRLIPMYIYNTEKGDTFGNCLWLGISFGYSF
jgi:hypothetical protein